MCVCVCVCVCVCACASMYSYLCEVEIEKWRGAEILRGGGPSVFVKLKTDQKQNLLYFTIACDIEKKVMKICANILLKKHWPLVSRGGILHCKRP